MKKDKTPLPQKWDLSIVLDGNGNPVLVIESITVVILPFNEVSEQFAFEEGEGDRSLAYWRMAHENYCRRNHFREPGVRRNDAGCLRTFPGCPQKALTPESCQGSV
jgi:uncharacterized protein YhfF